MHQPKMQQVSRPLNLYTGQNPRRHVVLIESKPNAYNNARARILKHLLEAEKTTFREEPSFQRSESTTGFGHALVVVC